MPPAARLANVNVGVMGHVDSGKTSLVRVLSTQLSTAALDKHPQSQQRGITLDLGFSALRLSPSPTAAADDDGERELQLTLVDCPGHAALFKTILGGARIIDMVLLVVDATKGLQPQTVESLLVAELAVRHHVVVALNKVDLLPASAREKRVRRAQSEIRAFLSTHFVSFRGREVPVIPVSAAPQAATDAESNRADHSEPSLAASLPLGIAELVEALRSHLHIPERDLSGPFSLAIDHCFAIQGNGTILTGTVLSGAVRVGDTIEIPSLQVVKKVKSMQMFRQSVAFAAQGDRVGIRVNGLDASLVERGMAITPRSMAFVAQVVVPVHRIPFFQGGSCKTGGKFHATVGHTTVVAVATFFARIGGARFPSGESGAAGASESEHSAAVFDPACLYEFVEQVEPLSGEGKEGNADEASSEAISQPAANFFALLQFDQPILCQHGALVVCSRLDLDPKKFTCRLAFHGRVQAVVTASGLSADDVGSHTSSSKELPQSRQVALPLTSLRIGKIKSRAGVVDKVVSKSASGGSGGGATRTDLEARDVICREMFSKDVDWQVYANVTVLFEASRVLGRILGPFGKTGKFRVELLDPPTGSSGRRRVPVVGERIILRFVKLVKLKPPAIKGKGGAASAGVAGGGAQQKPNGGRAKVSGNLLQDDLLLYPETLTPLATADASPPAPSTSVVEREETSTATHSEASVQPTSQGRIERLKGETTPDGRNPFAIVSGLFLSDAEASRAIGWRVVVSLSTGEEEHGAIEKPFGKVGKVRVAFAANGGTRAREGDAVALILA